MLPIYIKSAVLLLILAAHLSLVSCDVTGLEKHSVYYGFALTAINNGSDNECRSKMVLIEEGIRHNEKWALKLLDASGAPETGLYWSNTYWMGSKKQCDLATSLKQANVNPYYPPYTPETPQTVASFPVSYFSAYFYHNSEFQIFTHVDNETKITLGLCLPAFCEEQYVSDILQEFFDSKVLHFQKLYNASFTMDEVLNTGKETSWIWHPISFLFIINTLVTAIFVLLGTVYDLFIYQPALEVRKSNEISSQNGGTIEDDGNQETNGQTTINQKKPTLNKFQQIILSFSWYTNFQKVFTMTLPPGGLAPINGLRVLMTSFIISSHSFFFVNDYVNNRASGLFINDSFIGQIYANSSYAVDVFFFLGGFLLIHGLWRSKDLRDESNLTWSNLAKLYIQSIFKRFRRLTPVYMFTLGMMYSLSAAKYPSKPMWTNERNDLQCDKYWWTNLLYINNLYPGTYSSMCMSWTYYLSCDMQFYIWTSLIFYISKKCFKIAASLLVGTFCLSLALLGIMTYLEEYRSFADMFYITAPVFYYPPWMRIGPYIIGASIAYLFNKLDKKIVFKKITVWFLWILTISTLLYLFLAFSDRDFPIYFSILHTMFSRNVFALCTGWIVLSCLTGNGGPMNTFLSAKGFTPFSNLTYTAYLMNPILIYFLISGNDRPWQMEFSFVILTSFGIISFTYFCSVFVTISVEYPSEKIYTILFESNDKKPKLKNNDSKLKTEEDSIAK